MGSLPQNISLNSALSASAPYAETNLVAGGSSSRMLVHITNWTNNAFSGLASYVTSSTSLPRGRTDEAETARA